MSARLIGFMLAGVAAASGAPAMAKGAAQSSEFRPGISVEPIYRQTIEYFFTNWLGRVEKTDGPWRDIYFETHDKYVNKGIISFNCANANADIGLVLYDVGEYGNAADRRVVRVRLADRTAWQAGRFQPLSGETPPFEFYLAARKRFCK